MRATFNLTVASLKMLLRDRAALIGTTAFPLLFVLVFALFDLELVGTGALDVGGAGAGAGDVPYFDFVLPGLLAMGLMQFTMVGIAGSVARSRETRVMRRITATPLSPSAYLVAQVVARLLLALVQVLLMLGLGLALGADVNGNPLLLLVVATLGNVTFLTLGLAVAGRAPTVDAANNLAGLATAPLMFLSGMFFPLESLPAAVESAAAALPITPLIDAMRAVALRGAGIGSLGGELLLLVGWIPVAFLLARWSFRFEQ